jgi:HPt (histidine-containing phosphotransfer) domain-containing protein
MTLRELYDQVGGSYDEALSRLQTEKLVGRFVVRFLDDPSCQNLFDTWERGDEKAAFEAAHAAKGVCANLSLTTLAATASAITEALRPGNESLRATTDVDSLVTELRGAYARTMELISSYAASL